MENEIIIDRRYGGLNPVQFGHEACAPGHAYGPAVRTYYLIHYIHRGRGIFERGGEQYQLGPGELFLIRPMEETYYRADDRDPWEYSWIGFTAEQLPLEPESPVLAPYGAGELFEAMRRCRDWEGGRSAYLSAKLWELFARILEWDRRSVGHVEKALTLMRSEYMNGITIQDIASRLNLERSYFSHLFRESVGTSPQEYLTRLRLEQAAELMTAHGTPPSVAAASTGYADIYIFSRMFKKYFGLSPRNYVKAFRA